LARTRKGQTLIVQFMIFFIIGLTLFLGVTTFFNYQSQIYNQDTTTYGVQMIRSYVSSVIMSEVLDCKQCDFANITFKGANTTSGNYYIMSIGSYGLNVSVPAANKVSLSSIHNLNTSLTESGVILSVKPTTVTFNRTQSKITIS